MAKRQTPKARSSSRARMWTSDLRGASTPAPPAAPPPTDDAWVTGPPAVAQRVPGIDEAPDTTYVDPEQQPSPRRAILIGVGVGLGITAIVGAIVFSSDSADEPTVAGPSVTLTRPTSTTAPSPTTTTLDATATTAAPVAPATAAPAAAPVAPAPPRATPRATANPAAPAFVDVPLPSGVSATLTTCAWQPTNGGQYEAGGTVTNSPSTNKPWTLTMHWLQNQREIAKASTIVTLGAGQSKPWSITLAAPTPPAEPFGCSLTAS